MVGEPGNLVLAVGQFSGLVNEVIGFGAIALTRGDVLHQLQLRSSCQVVLPNLLHGSRSEKLRHGGRSTNCTAGAGHASAFSLFKEE